MHAGGGSAVGVEVPLPAGVAVGVGVGVGIGGVVLGGDDVTDSADVAAAEGASGRSTGGPLSLRTWGAPGGSTTAGRAVVAAPASMVAGGGLCCDGTSAGPDPSLGDAVAGGGGPPVSAGDAALDGTGVGGAGGGVSATAGATAWELGEWLLPSASTSPPARPASAVTTPTAARVRRMRRGVAGTSLGESAGSAEFSARIRSAVSAAGLRWVRPDRSSVSTTWASVARRFASSSCIGSSARGDGGRVPKLSMVSRPGRPGCRAPPAGACRRGKGPARPPGSSSSGSPRG
ncbi:MAG: hypothetical protein JWQ37_631 [Blastococcus sp.]|nr:hypothetical protein [Blastococcus sp.]